MSYCCPLSPSISNSAGISDDVPEGWDSLEDADVLIDPVAKSEVRLDTADDEVDIDTGDAAFNVEKDDFDTSTTSVETKYRSA